MSNNCRAHRHSNLNNTKAHQQMHLDHSIYNPCAPRGAIDSLKERTMTAPGPTRSKCPPYRRRAASTSTGRIRLCGSRVPTAWPRQEQLAQRAPGVATGS